MQTTTEATEEVPPHTAAMGLIVGLLVRCADPVLYARLACALFTTSRFAPNHNHPLSCLDYPRC